MRHIHTHSTSYTIHTNTHLFPDSGGMYVPLVLSNEKVFQINIKT